MFVSKDAHESIHDPNSDGLMAAPPSRLPHRHASSGLRALLRRRGDWLTGYLFVLPAVLIIGVFGLFPIGYALYMSLFQWRVRKGDFIGLANYERIVGNWGGALAFFGGVLLILVAHWLWRDAFRGRGVAALRVGKALGALGLLAAGVAIALGWNTMVSSVGRSDLRFLQSLVRTVFYAFGSIPVQIFLALVFASMLFQKLRGQELFRMLYFLPYVTPAVAGAAVFRSLFSARESSLANQVLAWFGMAPLRWVQEPTPVLELLTGWDLPGMWAGPSLALVTAILFGIWTFTGYNTVIFLAGLGGIPKNLYEAAEIDGAGRVQQFWNITVPLLAPVTFYLTVLGFIGTFQAFTHLYVLRTRIARDTLDVASITIFQTFISNNWSLAAAQSIFLFVVILLLTFLQNRLFGRRAFGG